MTVNAEQALVHLMFSGRQHDIPVSDLDVGDLSTPTEVRRAVAEHLSVPVTKLDNFTVERNESGDILMRPQAIFGA